MSGLDVCPEWCTESNCWGDHTRAPEYVEASTDEARGFAGAEHPVIGVGMSMAAPGRPTLWVHVSAHKVDAAVDLTPTEARQLAVNLTEAAEMIAKEVTA